MCSMLPCARISWFIILHLNRSLSIAVMRAISMQLCFVLISHGSMSRINPILFPIEFTRLQSGRSIWIDIWIGRPASRHSKISINHLEFRPIATTDSVRNLFHIPIVCPRHSRASINLICIILVSRANCCLSKRHDNPFT